MVLAAAAIAFFMFAELVQAQAVLEDFRDIRKTFDGARNVWDIYSGEDPGQTFVLENGMAKITSSPQTGCNYTGCGVYFHFNGKGNTWSYPGSYIKSYLRSGTWNPLYNRLRFKFRCNANVGFSESDAIQYGTYIRHPETADPGFAGPHFYHKGSFNLYTNRWMWVELNSQPQHEVGISSSQNHPNDPEWTRNTPGNQVHYYDGLVRVYFDTQYGFEGGKTCYLDDWTLDYETGEPDAHVATLHGTYSGSRYEVSWMAPKMVNGGERYLVRYSTAGSLKTAGFSTGTDGGTATGPDGSGYQGTLWTSPNMAEIPTLWVAIRPKMPIQSAGGGPVAITMPTDVHHGLATGDQVLIENVCSAANGTRTVTVTGLTTVTLNGTSGSCSYSSGGTMTATSETKNFTEYAIPPQPGSNPPPVSSCDVDGDGSVTSTDVGLAADSALGRRACTTDLNQDGRCSVVDVQRIVSAALGGSCRTTP